MSAPSVSRRKQTSEREGENNDNVIGRGRSEETNEEKDRSPIGRRRSIRRRHAGWGLGGKAKWMKIQRLTWAFLFQLSYQSDVLLCPKRSHATVIRLKDTLSISPTHVETRHAGLCAPL